MDSSKSSAGRSEPPTNRAKPKASSSPKTRESRPVFNNSHDELRWRKNMLNLCLWALSHELSKQPEPNESGDRLVEIKITPLMASFIFEGMMRAKDGENDPFGIKPKKGRPAKDLDPFHLCYQLFFLRRVHKMTYEEAIELLAQEHCVSERAIANVLASDKETYAEFERNWLGSCKK